MTRNNAFTRFLREPLVHFLVLGAALFALYASLNPDSNARPNLIVVDELEGTRLVEQFQRTWMRAPTRQEFQGLIDEFVKEEVLYREALALGLDQDDLIIRRRMRQKMEFLNADLAEQQKPTHAELQAYLEANPNKFRSPARFGFRQIYFDPEGSDDDARRRAEELLERLVADPMLAADTQALGDPTLLPPALQNATLREITANYGGGLAGRVEGAPTGRWSGPYASSFGLHLIQVTDREEASMPSLDEIRPTVEREWTSERRTEANDRFYKALRDRYEVEIRLSDDSPRDTLAASAE